MISITRIAVASFSLLSGVFSTHAAACSCAGYPFEYKYLLEYSLIVGGTVTEAKKTSNALNFRIEAFDVFRGEPSKEYDFVSKGTGGGDCGLSQITVGLYYVFFTQNPPNISFCTFTYAPSRFRNKEELERRHKILYEAFDPVRMQE